MAVKGKGVSWHKPGMSSGCSGHYGTGGAGADTVQTVKTPRIGKK
jgi:hypothetical protein